MAASDAIAQGYADMLSREEWAWFATLTFSPTKPVTDKYTGKVKQVERFHPLRGMHLEAADKAFRWWVKQINDAVYGPNWHKRERFKGGLIWARGQEFHKSGRVHFHAVMAAPDGDLNKLASRYHWHELWFKEFGRNQLEKPDSQAQVGAYVSKYVAKDGEVDFSPNFGEARPWRIFDRWQDREAGILIKPALEADQGSLRVGIEERRRKALLSLTLPVRPRFGNMPLPRDEQSEEPTE